jgi:cytochrome oxidase Cu insertion factor (SCO1/SenC/PrrC family)
LVFWAAAPRPRPQFRGVDITGADYAKDLRLPDHNGQQRSMADFKGKVVIVFFGYTQCPDVCPTSMAELAEVKKLLGPDGDKLQGIFVTVDPERDTAEMLKAYMTNFDPSFLALIPTPEQLTATANIFFIAATSIWRMRSALTPYSAARSCSVMPPELSSLTFSQRSSTMRRLRASSTVQRAQCRRWPARRAGGASIIAVGSWLSSAR